MSWVETDTTGMLEVDVRDVMWQTLLRGDFLRVDGPIEAEIIQEWSDMVECVDGDRIYIRNGLLVDP